MTLAVRTSAGEVLLPPEADTVLHEGDVLIVLGPATGLAKLAEEAS